MEQVKLDDPNRHIPAIDERPVMYDDLLPYWRAFNELSSSRNLGFSAGCIPYSEIRAWCDENMLFGVEREEYFRWIMFIDTNYMRIKREKDDS